MSFGDEVRVARKPHSCDACGARIQTGERHHVWAWSDGGSVYRGRAHGWCVTVAAKGWYRGAYGYAAELPAIDEFRDACEEYERGPFPWSAPTAPSVPGEQGEGRDG